MGFNRERGLPRVPTVHVTRMRTSQRARYHFMGCVRVRNRHLLCHSKVLRSAPFLQFSQASFSQAIFLSSSFRKQCLEYGLPVARHRALLCPQRHLRVMRSQRLLSVPSRSMISATGVRTLAWTTPAERRTWLPACSSTTTSSAPSLVHQPPVNHRCNVTTRTSRGSWTTPFATRSVRRWQRALQPPCRTCCHRPARRSISPETQASFVRLTGRLGVDLRPSLCQPLQCHRERRIASWGVSTSISTISYPRRSAWPSIPLVSFGSRSETTALSCLQTKAPAARGWSAMFTISAPGWRHGQRTCTSSYRLPPREPRSFSLTKRL